MPTNCRLFLPAVRFSPELLPSFLFMIDFSIPVTIKEADGSNRVHRRNAFFVHDKSCKQNYVVSLHCWTIVYSIQGTYFKFVKLNALTNDVFVPLL